MTKPFDDDDFPAEPTRAASPRSMPRTDAVTMPRARTESLTSVIDDPDAALHPVGCITTSALRSLADTIDRLERLHKSVGGVLADLPCLRRVESANNEIIASIATGPSVGGSWVRLILRSGTWVVSE